MAKSDRDRRGRKRSRSREENSRGRDSYKRKVDSPSSRSSSRYRDTNKRRKRSSRSRSGSNTEDKQQRIMTEKDRKRMENILDLEDKDASEQKLEEEMRRRRERIEQWRQERKSKSAQDSPGVANLKNDVNRRGTPSGGVGSPSVPDLKTEPFAGDEQFDEESAKSSPAGPEDDEMDMKNGEGADEDDEDPLDAFMKGVNKEVREMTNQRKGNSKQQSGAEALMKAKMSKKTEPGDPEIPLENGADQKPEKSKIVMVTKIVNPEDNTSASLVKRGELIEQNADALEYSDEEEEDQSFDGSMSLATKAKQLASVDHSKIYYRPFRKDFYVEVSDLKKMTPEEVTEYRQELEGIRVRGKNCPKPIKSWAQCGCSATVLGMLKRLGYDKPTPIQCQAIPAIMSGRDIMGVAKTGSGKTLAFLIPLFRHVLDQDPLEDMDGPIALIMSPTRELAMQTHKECKKIAKVLGITSVCVYGGTGISEQIAELKRGTEIVVCTPGRMIDVLAANNDTRSSTISRLAYTIYPLPIIACAAPEKDELRVTNLRRVTYLVLDEADRMFDMGFEPQVMKIIGNIRPDRQTVMFSATFPRQMEALAKKALQKPLEIVVGGRSVVCKDVEQHVEILEDEDQKFLKLLELLGIYCEYGSAIVFVDKQEAADSLLKDLMSANYRVGSLHGGVDQVDRDQTISDFKASNLQVLVATSVAARGLDVKECILVVNFDCPNHYEDYVHRVGRTGRAGHKGYAYTFVLTVGEERSAGDVVYAFELSGTEVPKELQKMWDDYKERMAAEGKPVKMGGGGFGGKGFKFDETEAEAMNSKKKMEKLVHGLQDSDDEEEDEFESQIQSIMKSTRRIKDPNAPEFGGASLADPAKQFGISQGLLSREQVAATASGKSLQAKIQLARELARKVDAAKNIGHGAKDLGQQTAEAVLKGTLASQPNVVVSAKTRAQELAERLNQRLNYVPDATNSPFPGSDPSVESMVRFEEELEINDLPQQVRWRITSRECVQAVQEYADVGITVRGTHVPEGKPVPEGDKKLFLGIESVNELNISKAKAEIFRRVKEEMRKLAEKSAMSNFNRGRYKIL